MLNKAGQHRANNTVFSEAEIFLSVLNLLSSIKLRFVVQYDATSARLTANAGIQISNACMYLLYLF